jgi:CheY-like chemotaxis protein
MIKDVLIDVRNGSIIFSCPYCKGPGVFPIEMVRGLFGKNSSRECPLCGSMAAFDSVKIEGTLRLLIADNPKLVNPLESEMEAAIKPKPAKEDELKLGGNLILVLDREETYREDIKKIFSGLSDVEAYGGCKGAADFIKERAGRTTIMIMDVFLGDGIFIEVLDGIKDDDKASKIPVIIVHPARKDRPVIEQMSYPYSQIKRIVYKDSLLGRLEEISSKIPKK